MKLKDTIDTVISHNAIISIDIGDKNDQHHSKCIWTGMADLIPEKWLEYEFYPITNVPDVTYNLHIKLKNFYY